MRACKSSAQQEGTDQSGDEGSVEDELAKLQELQDKSGKKPKAGAKNKPGKKPKSGAKKGSAKPKASS